MSDALDRYIQAGEGISVEFKRCGSQPGKDTFETICSFANRQGGSMLLGIRDDCLLSSCGSPLWRVVSVRKSGGN